MAKDPAFLFYSDNFLSGTMFLTDEQAGKYIRLLCAQHLTGHLREKDMLKICKTYDEDIWEKFQKDSNGLYYNDRLEIEVNKRKEYSKSRADNRKSTKNQTNKSKNTSKSYVEHMGNENGNENGDINKTNKGVKKFQIPELELIYIEFPEIEKLIITSFFDYYSSNGWRVGKNPMKDWKASLRNWIRNQNKFNNNGNTNTKPEKRYGRIPESRIRDVQNRPLLPNPE